MQSKIGDHKFELWKSFFCFVKYVTLFGDFIVDLQFMQRASQREEKPKKEEEAVVIPNGNFPASAGVKKWYLY